MTTDPKTSEKAFSQKAKAAISGFAASAKAAAQLTAKQAERTKLTSVTLPHAYRELGKDIHSTGRYRDQFPDEFAKADELKGRIAGLRQASPHKEGETKSFTDRAKETAGKARDAAHAKTLEVELNSVLRKLGRAAFEKLGKGSGAPALTGPIEQCQQRLATLDAEIQAIDSSAASGALTPRRLLVGTGVVAVLVLCLGAWAMFGGGGSEPQVAGIPKSGLKSAQTPVTEDIPTGVPDVGDVVGDARSRLGDMTRRIEEQQQRNEAMSEAARQHYEETRRLEREQAVDPVPQNPSPAPKAYSAPSASEDPGVRLMQSTERGSVEPAKPDEAEWLAQRERAELIRRINNETAATKPLEDRQPKAPITEIARLGNYDLADVEATFSPDGRRAMSFIFGTVRVWDVESQKEIASTEIPIDRPDDYNVAIPSPQAKYLLYSDPGANVRTYWIWNSETGDDPRPLNLHGFRADFMAWAAFSPDDKYVMVRYQGGTVDRRNEIALAVWDLSTAKQIHRYDGYREGVFLPTDKRLLLAKPDSSPDNSPRSEFADFRYRSGCSLTAELDLLDFNGEVQRTFSLVTPNPDAIANEWTLSGDGKSLLTILLQRDKRRRIAASAIVRGFDIETGRNLYEFTLGEPSESWSILGRIRGLSHDGSLLVLNTELSPDGDRQVEIWDIPKGQMIHRLESETGGSLHVRRSEFYTHKGSLLTSENDLLEATGGTIALWDVPSGEKVVEYSLAPDGSGILAGLVCNDRQAVLYGNGFRFMQLPDWEPRKAARKLKVGNFGLLQNLDDFKKMFPDSLEQSSAVERKIGLTSFTAKAKSQGSELVCRFVEEDTWQIEYTQRADAVGLEEELREQIGPPNIGPTTTEPGVRHMAWDFPGVKLRPEGAGMHIELKVDTDGKAMLVLTNQPLKAKVNKIVEDAIAAASLKSIGVGSVDQLRVGMSFPHVLAVLGKPDRIDQVNALGKQVVMWTYYPEPGKFIGLGFTNGILLEWKVGTRAEDSPGVP